MVDVEKLDAAAEKLRVYDVDQGAWEQEANGFEANATHVLLHLVKDLSVRDFGNSRAVEIAIAPDSVQYALRFMRWTGQGSRMAVPTQEQASAVKHHVASRPDLRSMPEYEVAFVYAQGNLASSLHNEDHESTRASAETRRLSDARYVGRLLTYSAVLQAEQFEFDLFEAFDARLAALRERFGIPEPEALTSYLKAQG